MKKYGITITNEHCWGCKTCEVACKQENPAADGIQLIRVLEQGPSTVQTPDFMFKVTLCRHCDEPACMAACPADAIVQRPDGIVILNEENCTGCELCIEACPFDAISFDAEKGLAQKCNLCHHRIDQGLIPACADNVCLAHCIHFNWTT